MKTRSAITILAVIVFLAPLPAFPWGHTSDMIVAQIALNQLTTKAKTEVQRCISFCPVNQTHNVRSFWHGAFYLIHTTERSLA